MAGSSIAPEDDDFDDVHEINVTPFIDVMLVLLIIFMVAAPLATVDVQVDLPASSAAPQPRPAEPLFLTVKRDLTLAIGESTLPRESLGTVLDEMCRNDKSTRIYLRADKSVAYGDLMQVMNLVRKAGYLKIALVGLESAEMPAAGPGGDSPAGEATSQ